MKEKQGLEQKVGLAVNMLVSTGGDLDIVPCFTTDSLAKTLNFSVSPIPMAKIVSSLRSELFLTMCLHSM